MESLHSLHTYFDKLWRCIKASFLLIKITSQIGGHLDHRYLCIMRKRLGINGPHKNFDDINKLELLVNENVRIYPHFLIHAEAFFLESWDISFLTRRLVGEEDIARL